MVNIQEEVKLLEAVRYLRMNPTLSFFHVANEFRGDADIDVFVSKLQDAYRASQRANKPLPQNEWEL